MKEQLLKLRELQGLDTEIDLREKALAGLDTGETARVEVESLTAQLAEASQKKKGTEKEYFDHELELKGIEAKKKKAEDLMYSGKVGNLKELQDLQKEVAMFGREIDTLSTRVLELMDEAELRRKEEKEAQAALQQAQAQLEEILRKYETTAARLKEETSALQAQREALAQTVTSALLRRYEKVKVRQGLIVVAAVERDVCGGCHVSLASELVKAVRASQSAQICESCGRLLVWTGSED